MAQTKTNILKNEPIQDFLISSLAKTDNIELTVAIINNVLKKYFDLIIDHVIENGTFTFKYLRIQVRKKPTMSLTKEMRKYYIIPKYSSAYSYTIEVIFKERLKAVYILKPDKRLLNKLKEKLDSSPDVKIKIYGKKTA